MVGIPVNVATDERLDPSPVYSRMRDRERSLGGQEKVTGPVHRSTCREELVGNCRSSEPLLCTAERREVFAGPRERQPAALLTEPPAASSGGSRVHSIALLLDRKRCSCETASRRPGDRDFRGDRGSCSRRGCDIQRRAGRERCRSDGNVRVCGPAASGVRYWWESAAESRRRRPRGRVVERVCPGEFAYCHQVGAGAVGGRRDRVFHPARWSKVAFRSTCASGYSSSIWAAITWRKRRTSKGFRRRSDVPSRASRSARPGVASPVSTMTGMSVVSGSALRRLRTSSP